MGITPKTRRDSDNSAEKDDGIVSVDLPEVSAGADRDSEFGGPEERREMEKRLLRKLDCRLSILIVIYILNYVCPSAAF